MGPAIDPVGMASITTKTPRASALGTNGAKENVDRERYQ